MKPGFLDCSAWVLDVLGLVDSLVVALLGWVVVSPWLVVIHWFETWFSFSRFMDGLVESVGFSGRHEELGVDLALGTEGSRVFLHDLLSMLLGLSSSEILFSIVLVSLVARPALLDCGVGTASGLASFDGLSREVSPSSLQGLRRQNLPQAPRSQRCQVRPVKLHDSAHQTRPSQRLSQHHNPEGLAWLPD